MAISAFISSLDINAVLSVCSFLLALCMFFMQWSFRRKEYELARLRLEHEIEQAKNDG